MIEVAWADPASINLDAWRKDGMHREIEREKDIDRAVRMCLARGDFSRDDMRVAMSGGHLTRRDIAFWTGLAWRELEDAKNATGSDSEWLADWQARCDEMRERYASTYR